MCLKPLFQPESRSKLHDRALPSYEGVKGPPRSTGLRVFLRGWLTGSIVPVVLNVQWQGLTFIILSTLIICSGTLRRPSCHPYTYSSLCFANLLSFPRPSSRTPWLTGIALVTIAFIILLHFRSTFTALVCSMFSVQQGRKLYSSKSKAHLRTCL